MSKYLGDYKNNENIVSHIANNGSNMKFLSKINKIKPSHF